MTREQSKKIAFWGHLASGVAFVAYYARGGRSLIPVGIVASAFAVETFVFQPRREAGLPILGG